MKYYVTMHPAGAPQSFTWWFDDPDERERFILGMRERGYVGMLFAGEEAEEE